MATEATATPAALAPPIRGVLPEGGGGGLYPVGDAGTVTLAEVDGALRVVAAGTAPGWRSQVDPAVGNHATGVAVAFTRSAGDAPAARVDFRARSAGGVVVAAVCPGDGSAALVVAGVQVATHSCPLDA